MSIVGAKIISEKLMADHSLQILNIEGNNIGDEGICAIAKALHKCMINELNVKSCKITFAGVISLAVALSSNRTIKRLWLWGNPITEKGALVILTSAVINTVCEGVGINEYYVEGEVKKMMRILKDRRSQGVMRILKDRRRQWVRYCMVECIILYTLM